MRTILLALSVILLACPAVPDDDSSPAGDDDSTVPDPVGDPATISLGGPCPLTDRLGGFAVLGTPSYTAAAGQVRAAVVPNLVLEPVGNFGACRLLRRNNPVCNPGCDSDETCTDDLTCIPFPLAVDLGVATIGGLLEPSIMQPVPPGQEYFDTGLPHPAWADGALVELRVDGSVLHGVGGPPVPEDGFTWAVHAGEPLELQWTPAPTPSRAIIDVSLNVDQHGLSPVTVRCTFPDDGVAGIPAAAVDALAAFGVSGFPSGRLARVTVDQALRPPGCIDFTVGFERPASVTFSP